MHFFKIIECSLSTQTVIKCWQTPCFGYKCSSTLTCCSCCNLQCFGFLLPLMMMKSHHHSEFCASLMYHKSDPELWVGGGRGLPLLETFTWQNLTSRERVTRFGGSDPTHHINVINLIWKIVWSGFKIKKILHLKHVKAWPEAILHKI